MNAFALCCSLALPEAFNVVVIDNGESIAIIQPTISSASVLTN